MFVFYILGLSKLIPKWKFKVNHDGL